MFKNSKKQKITVQVGPWRNFSDPWVGADTPGPGEAVFAIGFIEKPIFILRSTKVTRFRKREQLVLVLIGFNRF